MLFLGLPFSIFWPSLAPFIALLVSFVVYYVATARALRAFYAESWWGVSWRLGIFLVLLPPSLFLIQWAMFLAVDIALEPFDLSITQLFIDDLMSVANPESSP